MLNNQMVYPLQQFHAVTYEDKSSRKFPARRVRRPTATQKWPELVVISLPLPSPSISTLRNSQLPFVSRLWRLSFPGFKCQKSWHLGCITSASYQPLVIYEAMENHHWQIIKHLEIGNLSIAAEGIHNYTMFSPKKRTILQFNLQINFGNMICHDLPMKGVTKRNIMVLLLTSEHVLHSLANIAIDAVNTHLSMDSNTFMLVYPTANPIYH